MTNILEFNGVYKKISDFRLENINLDYSRRSRESG